MACHPRVTAWPTILQTHLPPWTKPHATVVALGSLGLVLARAWALTAVRAWPGAVVGPHSPSRAPAGACVGLCGHGHTGDGPRRAWRRALR